VRPQQHLQTIPQVASTDFWVVVPSVPDTASAKETTVTVTQREVLSNWKID